jgi:hypothetical protein
VKEGKMNITNLLNYRKNLEELIQEVNENPDPIWKLKVLDASLLYTIQQAPDEGITSRDMAEILDKPDEIIPKRLSRMFTSLKVIHEYATRVRHKLYVYKPTVKLRESNIIETIELIQKNVDRSVKFNKVKEWGGKYNSLSMNVVDCVVESGVNGITIEDVSNKLGYDFCDVKGEFNRWDASLMKFVFPSDNTAEDRKDHIYYPPSIKELASVGKNTFFKNNKHKVNMREAVKVVNKGLSDNILSALFVTGKEGSFLRIGVGDVENIN